MIHIYPSKWRTPGMDNHTPSGSICHARGGWAWIHRGLFLALECTRSTSLRVQNVYWYIPSFPSSIVYWYIPHISHHSPRFLIIPGPGCLQERMEGDCRCLEGGMFFVEEADVWKRISQRNARFNPWTVNKYIVLIKRILIIYKPYINHIIVLRTPHILSPFPNFWWK